MKRGVRLVNCARGGLVVEEDLDAALDSGQVAGAAIDVFVEEPARQNPLFGRDNVVATPHLGAATTEAQENVAVQIAEQMADFLLTGAVVNALNMPSLSAEEARRIKPYIRLAEQLGSFAGQLTESGITAVAIEYEGAIAELNVKPLTAIVLTALLAPQLATRQHGQRAGDLPRARHPRQRDAPRRARRLPDPDPGRGDPERAAAERRAREVAGTLFGGDKPRLVSVEGIPLGGRARRQHAVRAKLDKPGFIGDLGQRARRGRGQHRHLPPRPDRAGRGRDLPRRSRPAADPSTARHASARCPT